MYPSPTDILLRWILITVCLCGPLISEMYLSEKATVSIALIAGYELRCVFLAFGAPFSQKKEQS